MTNPTNEARADLAEEALRYFTKEAPGHTHYRADDIIDESDLGDLLTNLMHLCSRDGHDWDRVLSVAVANFEFEVEEERNEVHE